MITFLFIFMKKMYMTGVVIKALMTVFNFCSVCHIRTSSSSKYSVNIIPLNTSDGFSVLFYQTSFQAHKNGLLNHVSLATCKDESTVEWSNFSRNVSSEKYRHATISSVVIFNNETIGFQLENDVRFFIYNATTDSIGKVLILPFSVTIAFVKEEDMYFITQALRNTFQTFDENVAFKIPIQDFFQHAFDSKTMLQSMKRIPLDFGLAKSTLRYQIVFSNPFQSVVQQHGGPVSEDFSNDFSIFKLTFNETRLGLRAYEEVPKILAFVENVTHFCKDFGVIEQIPVHTDKVVDNDADQLLDTLLKEVINVISHDETHHAIERLLTILEKVNKENRASIVASLIIILFGSIFVVYTYWISKCRSDCSSCSKTSPSYWVGGRGSPLTPTEIDNEFDLESQSDHQVPKSSIVEDWTRDYERRRRQWYEDRAKDGDDVVFERAKCRGCVRDTSHLLTEEEQEAKEWVRRLTEE
jgi:hypothetical protein